MLYYNFDYFNYDKFLVKLSKFQSNFQSRKAVFFLFVVLLYTYYY